MMFRSDDQNIRERGFAPSGFHDNRQVFLFEPPADLPRRAEAHPFSSVHSHKRKNAFLRLRNPASPSSFGVCVSQDEATSRSKSSDRFIQDRILFFD